LLTKKEKDGFYRIYIYKKVILLNLKLL